MYANHWYQQFRCVRTLSLGLLALALATPSALAQEQASVIREISQANDRLEMTVNTSRILTLETRIPRLVVTNPELVTATPVSENQVQIAARKPGVTQINLWDENGKVYSVDIMIFGDVRELDMTLKRMFPESSLRVVKLSQSLVLEGQVDRPEVVSTIRTLAEDYAPKVVNNISVGGVQQIMLKVKVMEVSRTKLRRLGWDFAQVSGQNVFASSVSGILSSVSAGAGSAVANGQTVELGIVDGGDSFFGFLEAAQQNNVAKILADPTLVAVSGRPAHFNVGGEFPVIIPSGLGQSSVEYKKFGTQVDFVPIVLGNGRIRLEVRPRVSEIDDTRSVTLDTFSVPALRVREVDTGVEMNAGQTLAIAGLIQTRIDASHIGLPFLSDLPYIGAAFRRVEEEVNEIELLIMVTPEFVDGLEPHEVPQCGPGMESVSPSNCELYGKGHIEMPSSGPCGGAGAGGSTGDCTTGAADCQCSGDSCSVNLNTPLGQELAPQSYGDPSTIAPYTYGQGSGQPTPAQPQYNQPQYNMSPAMPTEATPAQNPNIYTPGQSGPPQLQEIVPNGPAGRPQLQNNGPANSLPSPSALNFRSPWNQQAANPQNTQNPYYRTAQQPQVNGPQPAVGQATTTPGLIGPVGYEARE